VAKGAGGIFLPRAGAFHDLMQVIHSMRHRVRAIWIIVEKKFWPLFEYSGADRNVMQHVNARECSSVN